MHKHHPAYSMERSLPALFFLTLCLAASVSTSASAGVFPIIDNSVNAVIGDISFLGAFGTLPTAGSDENVRIRTHLLYVESLLRSRDVGNLPPALRKRRGFLLDRLHEYAATGTFPRNYDYPRERRPCFIDRNGRICAVGYLVEQSAGRDAAERINARHRYDYIADMKLPELDAWVAGSGLTKEECAMIQPMYSPVYITDTIPVSYGIASALLGGANVSLTALNGIQIMNGSGDRIIPIAGMITGAGQIALGVLNVEENQAAESAGWNDIHMSERKNMVSFVNIGMGTATLLLSAWNLFDDGDDPADPSPINLNLHTLPAPDNGVGLGFTINGRF